LKWPTSFIYSSKIKTTSLKILIGMPPPEKQQRHKLHFVDCNPKKGNLALSGKPEIP
jgi:hypothetical protein